jgi:hypothetical protein
MMAKLMVNAALTAPLTGGVPGHESETNGLAKAYEKVRYTGALGDDE